MCRTKSYNDCMQSFLDAIVLRLDTYLLPNDYDNVATRLRDLTGAVPSNIQFTEINEQIIDIDSVAQLHNAYLNKILMSDLILLSHAKLQDIECEIYVNPYFIAFEIPSRSIKIEKAVSSVRESILTKLDFPLDFGYLRLNYSVNKKNKDEIWNICDSSAFPILDVNASSGQYIDSMKSDEFFIDLIRAISPSEAESDLVDINIQSKVIWEVEDINMITNRIMEVAELSKKEITRCFRG